MNNDTSRLEAIAKRLEAIHDVLDNLVAAIRATHERESEAKQREAIAEAEQIRLTHATERKRSAEEKKNLCAQWVMGLGTWAAVIAATVYAGIAASQLSEMRKATKAANDSVQAYMNGLSAQMIISYDPDDFSSNKKGPITLSNQGGSVATDVRIISGGGGGLVSARAPNSLVAVPNWKEVGANQGRFDKDCSIEPHTPGYPMTPQSAPKVLYVLTEPQNPQVLSAEATQVQQVTACYKDIFNRTHHADVCLYWNQKFKGWAFCILPPQ